MTISSVPKESLFLIRYPLWYLCFLPSSQMSLIPSFPLFLAWSFRRWRIILSFSKMEIPKEMRNVGIPQAPRSWASFAGECHKLCRWGRDSFLSHQVVAARSMAIWHQSLSPLLFHFIPLYFLSYLTTQSCPDIFYYFISSSIFFCISTSFKYA